MPAAAPTREPHAPALPPAGPVWFSSVMGTGILAILLARMSSGVPDLLVPATALGALSVLMLLGLLAGFGVRVVRDRRAFTSTLTDPAVLPTWGTVAMGILTVGAAVLTIAPNVTGHRFLGVTVQLAAAMWSVGTVLGVVTAFGFAATLLRGTMTHPVPAWGLPVVPPMASATTGAALVPHLQGATVHLALLVAMVGCFFLSLFLGGLIFAISYHHHYKGTPLPIAASISAWIPLGVVGQSMAAAQTIAGQSAPMLTAPSATAMSTLAHGYGYAMLLVSVPVIGYALRMTRRGVAARTPFTPGWWALTFPIGTLALGSQLLGEAAHDPVVTAIGLGATAALLCTWTFCAAATTAALARALPRRWNAVAVAG